MIIRKMMGEYGGQDKRKRKYGKEQGRGSLTVFLSVAFDHAADE